MGSIFEQEIFGTLKDLLVFLGGFAIFAVAYLVDNSAELSDHMEQVEDNLHLGDFLLDGFDIRIPHIHDDGFQGFSLLGSHLVEKAAEGPGFAVLADPDDPTGQVIQDNGEVPVSPADGNFVDGQYPEALEVGLAVLPFQKELVDVLDRFPGQTQVLSYFFDRHDLAEFVDILGQALGDPKVGMEQFQILDEDSLALKTKELAILAIQPYPDRGQIQIPHGSLLPAVDVPRRMPTDMADRSEALVWHGLDLSLTGFPINRLIDNSYSPKREVFCYTHYGHRRPPLDDILAQVYYPSEIPDVHYCLKS
jgi:hypothetical protein